MSMFADDVTGLNKTKFRGGRTFASENNLQINESLIDEASSVRCSSRRINPVNKFSNICPIMSNRRTDFRTDPEVIKLKGSCEEFKCP